MRPAAIALNYSVENIQNDVRQKIMIIIMKNSKFDSLVWGSLTLAPINWTLVYNYFTFVFNKYIVPW